VFNDICKLFEKVSLPSRCAVVMSTDDFRYDGYGCDAQHTYLEPNYYKSGFTSEYRTGPRHNEYVERRDESCVRGGHHHDDSYRTEKESFMHRREDRYTKECKGERSRDYAGSSDQYLREKRCFKDEYRHRDDDRSSHGIRFSDDQHGSDMFRGEGCNNSPDRTAHKVRRN